MIRLKERPIEPTKNISRISKYSIEDGDSIRDLYEYYPDGEIYIYYVYDNGDTYYIKYTDLESDWEFQIRYNKYLKDLGEYNTWYEKYKEEIENREAKKKEQYIKAKKTRLANLQKELNKVEKELSKVLK